MIGGGVAKLVVGGAVVVGRHDLAAVPQQHWRLELSGGIRFTLLSAPDAAAIMAREREVLPAHQGLLDWLGDLGDLTEAAADGIADIVSYTVSVLADGVKAVVTFVIDKVT